MTEESIKMSMVVVYKNPSDYPGEFVARAWSIRFDVKESEPKAGNIICRSKNYEDIENYLSNNTTLVKLQRMPNDDPCILETWI